MSETTNNERILRALIIEDDENDALLLADHLESQGYRVDWSRVESEQEMIDKLQESWDIVFSDFTMPNFNGLRALGMLRESYPETPFVFISGTMGEELAVEALKSGAQDYLVKGNLIRLKTVVDRELREFYLRKERCKAEQSRARLVTILEASPDMVAILQPNGQIEYSNRSGLTLIDCKEEAHKFAGLFNLADLVAPAFAEQLTSDIFPSLGEEGVWQGETELVSLSGKTIPVSLLLLAHYDEDGEVEYFSVTARDISERK